MKKHNEYPRWWPLAIFAVIVCTIWFVLVYDTLGGTYKKRLRFQGDYDSVLVVWAEKSGDTSLFTDSLWVTSISTDSIVDTSISLDDADDWEIWYTYWSVNEAQTIGDFIKFTAGPATVSTADKWEIANYAEQVAADSHGTGSWTTGGVGEGAYSVTIVTVDTANSDTVPVPHVGVVARNVAQTLTLATTTTDGNGQQALNLDADTHIFIAVEAGYTWPTYDTHIIAGSQTDTIWGLGFIPTAPVDTYLCRLYGYPRDAKGRKIHGATIFVTPVNDTFNTCENTILSNETMSERVDTGYFYIDILRSSCRANSTYNIQLKARDGPIIGSLSKYVVPDSATHRLRF